MSQATTGSRASRKSPRRRAALVALVVLMGAVVLAVSGFEGTLTYYRTPTEVAAKPPPPDERFRVGGMVVPGSIRHDDAGVHFVLTDGATDLEVVSSSSPPRTFRAGEGAVVEGDLVADGVFAAELVVVRHSNEYRPPDGAG
ncbi:MAG TPA: cytochrome c maturation protein CcmE [Nocardioidaceae bacterium]|nr:cytochrome c maturation protein CcmE [Nocardioidaceae bacterium]